MKYKAILLAIIILLSGCSRTLDIENQTETGIDEFELNVEDEAMVLEINNEVLNVTLVDNSSSRGLLDMLKDGPITINMMDYASMEKVGSLGVSLPRNDVPTDAKPGDIILYQGSNLVIYYDTNSWNFTKLGSIDNYTQSELKELLGTKEIAVTLRLK